MIDRIRAVIVDDEPLARTRIRDLLAEHGEVEVVGEAGNGRDAVELVRAASPDLLFLDVQMPEMDGFAVLRKLRSGRIPVTIFITAYDDHAVRAFEFCAIDYLLKPFKRARFFEALERARHAASRDHTETMMTRALALLERVGSPDQQVDRIPVKVGQNIHLVRSESIDWIGAEGNYVRLHVGAKSYLLRVTMSAIAKTLDPRLFLRIHRGTIVNVERIRELQSWFNRDYKVILVDGTELILSRSYRKHAHMLFGKD